MRVRRLALEYETMRTRGNLVQLKRYRLKERTRHLAQLERMIADFERMAQELSVQIEAEERKSGITDHEHFAYPTFARAARQRRDNLLASRDNLLQQREDARHAVAEARAELEKAEQLDSRDGRAQEPDATSARGALIG
jgi:flagellar export protein FliJ